ncbi:hypothetical protein ABTM91_20420, partial [Acinetobacter baumannii]
EGSPRNQRGHATGLRQQDRPQHTDQRHIEGAERRIDRCRQITSTGRIAPDRPVAGDHWQV